MSLRRNHAHNNALRQAKVSGAHQNTRWSRRGRRTQAARNTCEPFAPPEDWHEPDGEVDGYRVVVQQPGEGYRHILTPAQIRRRLENVPQAFLESLEVVQLSRMTQKKKRFPCYGMQWGSTLYLYPLEESLEELFYVPPRPEVVNEAKMYGGRWDDSTPGVWRLIWSTSTIEDFYLNNILIHELGHLVDDRNNSYTDRERYAEWFAIHHGYRPSGGGKTRRRTSIRRRHHRT